MEIVTRFSFLFNILQFPSNSGLDVSNSRNFDANKILVDYVKLSITLFIPLCFICLLTTAFFIKVNARTSGTHCISLVSRPLFQNLILQFQFRDPHVVEREDFLKVLLFVLDNLENSWRKRS